MEIVNPVPGEEFDGWTATLMTTFLRPPRSADFAQRVDAWRTRLEPERTWGARDRGRWVATLATDARQLTIPGPAGSTRDLPVDALTGVTVNATHRRRGLLRAMIDESLRAAKERGDALSILVAAEWPIYGRFGYAPAARHADYTYRPRTRNAAITPDPSGVVRQVEPEELVEYAGDVFARARTGRAGQIDRPARWWVNALGIEHEPADGRANLFVHEGADGPDGILAWQPVGDFDLDGSMAAITVADLVTATPTAYRNLWAYLSGIDVVDEIRLHARPVDEPARWLADDGRALRETYSGDFLWACLLDVPAALAARGYRVPGRLVLEVVDGSTHGYAAGRYALDAGPDGATCTATSEGADLQLPARALAAAFLGGYGLRPLALAGGVDELTPGAVDRLDAMLTTAVAPWCQTGF